MSYDTSIIISTGKGQAEVEDCGNMTSNIGKMYDKAMPGPYHGGGRYDGIGESDPGGGLIGLSGLKCPAACNIIISGIQFMQDNEVEVRKLAPKNGWGSYEGAIEYLRTILSACAKHPDATLAVNW